MNSVINASQATPGPFHKCQVLRSDACRYGVPEGTIGHRS